MLREIRIFSLREKFAENAFLSPKVASKYTEQTKTETEQQTD